MGRRDTGLVERVGVSPDYISLLTWGCRQVFGDNPRLQDDTTHLEDCVPTVSLVAAQRAAHRAAAATSGPSGSGSVPGL